MNKSDPISAAKRAHKKWGVLAICLAVVAVCILVPPLQIWFSKAFAALGSADVGAVISLIRSYGSWAAAISFLLMVLQSVAAPIPAFLLTLSNAAIFGWWQGAILSWSSAMAGASLCFFLARALGRDTVAKLIGRSSMGAVETFFERYGKHTILICRLLPFLSFDAVSYMAGLTSMDFWSLFLATGLGQLPATIVYSYVGGILTGGLKYFVYGLTSLFAFSVVIFMAKQLYNNRNSPAQNVFFPGCALMELDPAIVQKTLDALRKEVPDMALCPLCCGYPARYARSAAIYEKKAARLRKSLERRGVKRIYSACPNCTQMLGAMGCYEIIPIWGILARTYEQGPIDHSKTWALHDPCPTRWDAEIHESVRALLRRAGVPMAEFPYNREGTHCCGQFHMLHRADPAKSANMCKSRAEEAPVPRIVSYCQGCINSFTKEGVEAAHILELLYGPSRYKGWFNRFRTRYFPFGDQRKRHKPPLR